MRKHYLLALAIAVAFLTPARMQAAFTTSDTGTRYTLATLSQNEQSGVSLISDGIYSLTGVVTIAPTDTFELESGVTLKLDSKAELCIQGTGIITPTQRALVTRLSTGYPKGIRGKGRITVRNVDFEYASVSCGADSSVIENCTFDQVTVAALHSAAIMFTANTRGNVVRNCKFTACEQSAVATLAFNGAGVLMEDCIVDGCFTRNTNTPQVALMAAGQYGPVIVRNNTILGTTKNDMVGGLAVNNLVMTDDSEIIIEGNTIKDNRFGIWCGGAMNVIIRDNDLIDNRYAKDAKEGSGCGIRCVGLDKVKPQNTVITGNRISGNMIGVMVMNNNTTFNAGNLTVNKDNPAYNPGRNIFSGNGYAGTAETGTYAPASPCDFYNATANTVYAQGNTWGVAEQTAEEIAKAVWDKADDPALGEVIYIPAGNTGGVTDPQHDEATEVARYTVSGILIHEPVSGVNIVRYSDGSTRKVLVK